MKTPAASHSSLRSGLRCIVDAAGKEQVVALFDAMSGSSEASFPFDLLADLVPALQSCGVDLIEQTGG